MTNTGAVAPPEPQDESKPSRAYRATPGSAVASRELVSRLGHAAFLVRLVYNAAIDDRVPFAEGFAYRHRLAEARRAGTDLPAEPIRSETFLPGPTAFGLGPELTRLRAVFPALALYPRSVFDNAIAEACRARAAHVRACVRAKAEGRKPPRLHYRRADDAWTVSTDDFQMLRIGTDHAQRPGKTQNVTPTTLRNRRRRIAKKQKREDAKADEKVRCGWSPEKVAAYRERRLGRQARDRDLQRALQVWTADERKERRVRRDSPKATIGQRRMKVDVVGLGRFRIDVGTEISEGAETVRLTLVKPAWHGAKVEVRLTYTVPEEDRSQRQVETGHRLHDALRNLPEDATRLDAVEAARGAGLLVRGQDLGIANPSCDDRGVVTKPVRMPRADLQAMRRAQERLSWKDRCRKEGLKRKPGKKRKGRPTDVRDAQPVGVATPPQVDQGTSERTPRPKRSAAAERERALLARINHKAANRQRTRAHQDASSLMRDGPMLVATDPRRMVPPLLAKDGPAERRARRLAGPAASPAVLAGFVMGEKRRRAMRRNLHATRFSERIRRVGVLAERAGAIHCTPGHEGTSSCCPACYRVRKKDLRERRHDCPCGLSLPRDHASALETLGRGLLLFRDSPDPDGMIAQAISERDQARAKILARRVRQGEAARDAAARRRAVEDEGRGVPRQPGRGASGPPTAKPKRLRGQGRNVRRIDG